MKISVSDTFKALCLHAKSGCLFIKDNCEFRQLLDDDDYCFCCCLLKIKENKTPVFDTTMAWRTDSYYSMGILGYAFYVLLGITSLPSVSNALSWREFSFIQVDTGMCVPVI